MKTEEEIKEEIKKRIQNSWKHGNKELRQRTRCGCDALVWFCMVIATVIFVLIAEK